MQADSITDEELPMRWIEEGVLEALWAYRQRPTYADAQSCVRNRLIIDATLTAAHHMREAATEQSWRRVAMGVQPFNHRHFMVGGVAIGIVADARDNGLYEWWVSAAWNTKPQPGDVKYCAERRLGRRALKAGCRCLVVVAVVGERNDDSRSGISYQTLEPCEACRDDMRGMFRSLYRKETRVIMQNPLNSKRVEKTITQLMHGHGETWS